MPEMVAKVAQEYPVGTVRQPGEKFHVEPHHVRLLVAIGRLEPPAGEAAAQSRSVQAARGGEYRTRDMAAPQPAGEPRVRKTRNRRSLLGGEAA